MSNNDYNAFLAQALEDNNASDLLDLEIEAYMNSDIFDAEFCF